MSRVPHRSGERGMVLLLVIWVMVILVTVALSFAHQVRFDMQVVRYHTRELEALCLAKAGVERTLYELKNDAIADSASHIEGMYVYNAYTDRWSSNPEALEEVNPDRLEDSIDQYTDEDMRRVYTVRVIDETSKININYADEKMLMALFKCLGVEEEMDQRLLAYSVMDWRDRDEKPTSKEGMHEEEYFNDIFPGEFEDYTFEDMERYDEGELGYYRCKNDIFESVEELVFVRGITEDLYHGEDRNGNGELDGEEDLDGDGILDPGLIDVCTVYGDGKVNINTAGPFVWTVLLTMAGIPEESIEETAWEIQEYHDGGDGFISEEDEDDRYDKTLDDRDKDDMHLPRAGITNFGTGDFNRIRRWLSVGEPSRSPKIPRPVAGLSPTGPKPRIPAAYQAWATKQQAHSQSRSGLPANYFTVISTGEVRSGAPRRDEETRSPGSAVRKTIRCVVARRFWKKEEGYRKNEDPEEQDEDYQLLAGEVSVQVKEWREL